MAQLSCGSVAVGTRLAFACDSVNRMRATIAVCTWNRPRSVLGAVASAMAQDHPSFEVVTVDDGSDNQAREVLSSAVGQGVRVVYQEHAGLNAARNVAVREARGDFVAFLDDDEEAAHDWLRELDAAMERHPDAGCVGGPLLAPDLPTPRTCTRCSLKDGERDLGEPEREVDRVIGGNMAIPKWAFAKVGLFDDRISGIGDDDEWMRRARALSLPIIHAPAARILHLRDASDYTLRRLTIRTWRKAHEIARYHELLGIPAPESIGGAPRQLGHALRFRCWAGALNAVACVGVSLWTVWLRLMNKASRQY